jgi:oligopeptide/dipeptide ABC transporter ATP-binding protein
VLLLLDMVGLSTDMLGRYPHEFSGGQRQRICIARALAINPKLIICDEPVSALDVSIQAQVINLLTDLQGQFKLSYLFISHDLAVVGYLSHRIAVMYQGRIVELARAQTIFDNPLHPYTQRLMAAVPEALPRAQESRSLQVSADLTGIQSRTGCPYRPSCPKAMNECTLERPELKEAEEGHFVACFGI